MSQNDIRYNLLREEKQGIFSTLIVKWLYVGHGVFSGWFEHNGSAFFLVSTTWRQTCLVKYSVVV